MKGKSGINGFFQGLKGWLCSMPAIFGDSIKAERIEEGFDEEALLLKEQKPNKNTGSDTDKRELIYKS